MHRKLALMWITAALLLTLPACSAAATTSGAGTQSAAAATGEVSLAVKLAAGTLKLEGSAQAVTPEQARALLPLWKAARNLATSDTISQAELDGLYEQIQETMSAEQNQAIEALGLSAENLRSLMVELGVQAGPMGQGGGQGARNSGQASSSGGTARSSGSGGGGGFPGGGMPPDMGGFPGGGLPPDMQGASGQRATAAAAMASRARTGAANPFVATLITLLEKRAAE